MVLDRSHTKLIEYIIILIQLFELSGETLNFPFDFFMLTHRDGDRPESRVKIYKFHFY